MRVYTHTREHPWGSLPSSGRLLSVAVRNKRLKALYQRAYRRAIDHSLSSPLGILMHLTLWLFGHEVFDIRLGTPPPLPDEPLVASSRLETELEQRDVLCGHCEDCDEDVDWKFGFNPHICGLSN